MSPSPHRKWLRVASVTLALGLIVYMIVLPAVDAARQRFQPQPTMRVLEDLYLVQLISGGDNLPIRDPNHYRGVVWIIFYTKWDLVGLYFYHGYLFCVLFSWALIQADGHRMAWAVEFQTTNLETGRS